MKEDGSARACLVREFQMREFVPAGAKWSPCLALLEVVLASWAIIFE